MKKLLFILPVLLLAVGCSKVKSQTNSSNLPVPTQAQDLTRLRLECEEWGGSFNIQDYYYPKDGYKVECWKNDIKYLFKFDF